MQKNKSTDEHITGRAMLYMAIRTVKLYIYLIATVLIANQILLNIGMNHTSKSMIFIGRFNNVNKLTQFID